MKALNVSELLHMRQADTGRRWYRIENLQVGEAEVFLFDVIGESWLGGISAAQFVKDLRAVLANKIVLHINSPGGDINDAVAIRNALIEHPATIETHVDGIAASSASWVGLAAQKVVMAPHSTMMIHEPFNLVLGDAEVMRKQAEVLDMFGDNIADMFVEKAGGSRKGWRDRMRAETWYTDQEAVDAGLADEIYGAAVGALNVDPALLKLYQNTPRDVVERCQGPDCPDERLSQVAAAARLNLQRLRFLGMQRERVGLDDARKAAEAYTWFEEVPAPPRKLGIAIGLASSVLTDQLALEKLGVPLENAGGVMVPQIRFVRELTPAEAENALVAGRPLLSRPRSQWGFVKDSTAYVSVDLSDDLTAQVITHEVRHLWQDAIGFGRDDDERERDAYAFSERFAGWAAAVARGET